MADEPMALQSSESHRVSILTTRNLSVVLSAIVVIVALLKAKQDDIPKIVQTLVGSNTFAAVGWTLAAVFLIGGVVSIKLLITTHDKEVARIYKERDELQTKLLRK